MDFFARQDKARRNTKVLVFYFTLAVVMTVAAVYAAVFVVFTLYASNDSLADRTIHFLRPDLLLGAVIGTLGVVFAGSVTKTMELRDGGSAVAEMLEGRLLNSNTTDLKERTLLNVVEEMAIASGVPVPQVYVMDEEQGINAFAAGFAPSDAVIGVTAGALKLLSRDELQGIIGHEFSHILNGDMRLNLRLMGLVFGILCLTVVGRGLLRTRGKKNPLPLLGLALIVIGIIGVFFGRLIQAAVSRQREILADASSTQFTRNPAGLAGALKKIGGLEAGSQVISAHAEETCHLFFANALRGSFFGLMATHPSLEERIRELDPMFDGNFPTVVIEDEPAPPPLPASQPPSPMPIHFPGFDEKQFGPIGYVLPLIAMESGVPNVGRPTERHLSYAIDLRRAIPPELMSAVQDPLEARSMICALVLSDEPSARQTQLDELDRAQFAPLADSASKFHSEMPNIPAQTKIPLIDLALPALRRLSAAQFQEFRAALKVLVESDRQISLFEFMLQKIVLRHLESYFVPVPKRVAQYYALSPLVGDCGVLISAVAHAGQSDPEKIQDAFVRGSEPLRRTAQARIPFFPQAQCDLPQIETALQRLADAAPQIKKNLLNACAATIAADRLISENEAELIRAIADALDCPVPPFVDQSTESLG